MHHLEPLAWTESPPCDQRKLPKREHGVNVMTSCSQRSFRSIATFLEGCRQAAPAALLARYVLGARELGCITFGLAVERCSIGFRLRSDWVRCLDDLSRLADSLSSGAILTRSELTHALDTLFGLLIQLESNAQEPIASRRNRPLTPLSTHREQL